MFVSVVTSTFVGNAIDHFTLTTIAYAIPLQTLDSFILPPYLAFLQSMDASLSFQGLFNSLKGRVEERMREGKSSHSNLRPKWGAENSILLSHMGRGTGAQVLEPSSASPRMSINRKLYVRWSSRALHYGMQASHAELTVVSNGCPLIVFWWFFFW